ncbi:hypothetical protein [Paenisporosarcina indica]|nr:hypothetical protein [Paenisporosarcina indica]
MLKWLSYTRYLIVGVQAITGFPYGESFLIRAAMFIRHGMRYAKQSLTI